MQYERKIVAYIDILGFKNYIAATKSPTKQNDLYKALFSFKSSEQINVMRYPSRMASHFSDLLVITIDHKREYIQQLVLDLIHLADSIIDSASLLIRGVITEGEIIHENGIIFGPALIDAYEKERNLVKFPRILIDKSIFEPTPDGGMYNPVTMYFKWLGIDSEGNFFVNYLNTYIDYSLIGKKKGFGCFNNQKLVNIITKGLISEDSRVREKYEWIVECHNQKVKSQFDLGNIDSSIKEDWLIKI
jgi:hypothetical protein